MKIIKRLMRALRSKAVHPYDLTRYVIDHVPVDARDDWRKTKLAAAARKHGKPFKCAVDGLPREVLLISRNAVNADATEVTPEAPSNVVDIANHVQSADSERSRIAGQEYQSA